MRPYPRFGGESVSFACTSSPAHNLFFKFVLFPTITFVRLIRFALQTCAPCAFENAQVCDPTLSATKKEPLGLLFCGGESGIRTHGTLVTYTRFPIVLLRPARTSLHLFSYSVAADFIFLRRLFIIRYFGGDCNCFFALSLLFYSPL